MKWRCKLQIANGTWKPGSQLPNEVNLALQLGVSQGTMRKALDLLETEKVVSRQQGRGTIVIDHDTDEMAIRFSSIENSLGQRIAGHVTWSEAEMVVASEEDQKKVEMHNAEPIMRVRRIRSYRDHPFMYEEMILVAKYFPSISMEVAKTSRLSALAQKCGLQLSHAVETVKPVICPAERMSALGLQEAVPILLTQRKTFSLKGVPVEARTGWCHLRDKNYVSVTR